MKHLSTQEVARKVGIGRGTLERWLSSGKLRPPRTVQIGQGTFRNWLDADVERVRKHKQQNYRKGRGRKKGGKMTARVKKIWADPEFRARMSAAVKKAWARPEARARRIAAMKKAWAAKKRGA